MIHIGNVSLQHLVIRIISFGSDVGVNKQKGWDVVFDFFLNTTKSSNTLIAIILVWLSQTKNKSNMMMCLLQKDNWLIACCKSHQVKQKTSRRVKNDPKYGDVSMKKKKMLASATSIQKLSTWTNTILQMQNKLNMNILTVDASRKLNGKYLGIISTLQTIT